MIDIGGVSSELILGKGSTVVRVESFGIGNVNQSLAFLKNGVIIESAFE